MQRKTDRLLYPEVRYVRDGEPVELVQPQTSEKDLRPGRVAFNEEKHKGWLRCQYCDVSMVHHTGSDAICGTNLTGPRDHFQKSRGAEHDLACLIPMMERDREPTKYDLTKGYAINLNLPLGPAFDQHNPPLFTRDSRGRIHTDDPDLRDRQKFSVKSTEDLIKFIRRGEFARLQDSVVVYGPTKTPWQDFMIRVNKQDRFRNLVRDLKSGVSHPVLMEVRMAHAVRQDCAVPGRYPYEENGEQRLIVPRVYLDSPQVRNAFAEAGSYLVLAGQPRIRVEGNKDLVTVSVKDPVCIEPCDIQELNAQAQKRAHRREARPSLV